MECRPQPDPISHELLVGNHLHIRKGDYRRGGSGLGLGTWGSGPSTTTASAVGAGTPGQPLVTPRTQQHAACQLGGWDSRVTQSQAAQGFGRRRATPAGAVEERAAREDAAADRLEVQARGRRPARRQLSSHRLNPPRGVSNDAPAGKTPGRRRTSTRTSRRRRYSWRACSRWRSSWPSSSSRCMARCTSASEERSLAYLAATSLSKTGGDATSHPSRTPLATSFENVPRQITCPAWSSAFKLGGAASRDG